MAKPKKSRRLRKVLAVATFREAEDADREFWAHQTPAARLAAMEMMRWINYGKAAAGRLQRILEIVQPENHVGRPSQAVRTG